MSGSNRVKYPLLRVDTGKIAGNAEKLLAECAARGVGLWGVSKGMSAFAEVARAYEKAGLETIADSRLDNIRKMREAGVKARFALIRIPMRSELDEAAELCDFVLVSDTGTLKELGDACAEKGKKLGAIVMYDMGDLREGYWFLQAAEAARETARFDGEYMRIAGVGANFSCASGVLPSAENLNALVDCGRLLEKELGRALEIYSGGGTCSLVQMRRGLMPDAINNLRLGECLLLGRDTSFGLELEGLSQDTMRLEAELVEVRTKPTLPVGEIGHDAFGNVPVFTDRGDRRRGILAVGKQDVNIGGLTPLDVGVSIITASSDHLLVDIEERGDLKIGDVLAFRPDYTAMLSASTSPYVTKIFE